MGGLTEEQKGKEIPSPRADKRPLTPKKNKTEEKGLGYFSTYLG